MSEGCQTSGKRRMNRDRAKMRTLSTLGWTAAAVQEYQRATGSLPASLAQLREQTNSRAVLRRLPDADSFHDGWNRPLVYRVFGSEFVLKSAGADGIDGTQDDVRWGV